MLAIFLLCFISCDISSLIPLTNLFPHQASPNKLLRQYHYYPYPHRPVHYRLQLQTFRKLQMSCSFSNFWIPNFRYLYIGQVSQVIWEMRWKRMGWVARENGSSITSISCHYVVHWSMGWLKERVHQYFDSLLTFVPGATLAIMWCTSTVCTLFA